MAQKLSQSAETGEEAAHARRWPRSEPTNLGQWKAELCDDAARALLERDHLHTTLPSRVRFAVWPSALPLYGHRLAQCSARLEEVSRLSPSPCRWQNETCASPLAYPPSELSLVHGAVGNVSLLSSDRLRAARSWTRVEAYGWVRFLAHLPSTRSDIHYDSPIL